MEAALARMAPPLKRMILFVDVLRGMMNVVGVRRGLILRPHLVCSVSAVRIGGALA